MVTPSNKGFVHPDVDPGRPEPLNNFDRPTGFTGQAYSRDREVGDGHDRPSGHPLIGDTARVDRPVGDPAGRNIPVDNGRRASFDSVTGEVHGSGSGMGEDFDTATSGGAAGHHP